MQNIIVGLLIIIIITLSIIKIAKEKKNGSKCIGCPNNKCCSSKLEVVSKKDKKDNSI